MVRQRNPYVVALDLLLVAFLVLAAVGWVVSMFDTSTEAERACVTKRGREFMQCVYDAREARKP